MPELKEYAKGYQLVPVYKTIKAGEKQPVDLLRKLKNYSHKLFMLEHTNHDAETLSGTAIHTLAFPLLLRFPALKEK